MDAMTKVVESAIQQPQKPPDPRQVEVLLDKLGVNLMELYGQDILILQDVAKPGVDRRKVCSLTIGFYSEVLAVEDPERSVLLRGLLGNQ